MAPEPLQGFGESSRHLSGLSSWCQPWHSSSGPKGAQLLQEGVRRLLCHMAEGKGRADKRPI